MSDMAGKRSEYDSVVRKVADALIRASSSFRVDQIEAYRRVIASEENPSARWALETLLENAKAAAERRSPLCDDTGIPHLILEAGQGRSLEGWLFAAMQEGVALGLRELPGRPMAVAGDDRARVDQSEGMFEDPSEVEPAPIMVLPADGDTLRLHVLMQGGGPEIRANTYRVFHKNSAEAVVDEIVSWAVESVTLLGCTPSPLAIGIGRSHFEASSLMLQAMALGDFGKQSPLEKDITDRVNESGIGPLGLGGSHSVLATFLKVGPQRASGVRIVCMRPCCCMEPRVGRAEF
ncbi:MAG: fumarate hydratase [Clostridiales bacterium]|nr:fumarate hydratase [Clostridiales bacterium]